MKSTDERLKFSAKTRVFIAYIGEIKFFGS